MSRIVNLNTATEDDLRTLPGIGAKTAEAILAYRQEHGPFQRPEDLMEIRGLGPKKLARLRDWITVN
jgi:competence protein ComEA